MSSTETEPRQLSRGQIVGLAVASMIPAVGLAAVPALMFVSAGNGSWLSALLSAAVTTFVGLSVVTFARRHVANGSLYSYLSLVFGPWARLVAAAALLLGYAAMIAGITMVIGVYVGSFLLSRGFAAGLEVPAQLAVYAVALLIAVLFARRGVDLSVKAAVVLMAVAIPVVGVVVVAGAATTGLHLAEQLSFEGGFSFSGVFQGMAAGATFLMGFESCAALARETKDPKRDVPFAVLGIPVLLGVVYLVATVLQVPGLFAAADDLAAGMSPAAALALNAGLGETFASATDLVLAVATFAGLIGFVNFGSRFVATLSDDGLLPRRVGRAHPEHGSPTVAVTVLAVIGFAVLAVALLAYPESLLSVYSALATLIVYLWVFPYVLICAAHVVLLVRERAVRPLSYLTAVLGATAMGWVYLNGWVNPPASPVDAMSYVALVLIGVTVPALAWARRGALRSARESSGAREVPEARVEAPPAERLSDSARA
ncbi:APC family permease [Streptomyces sp. NPDC060334]|uniref:APC family permease n=1 Tax=unclassified Streptomyces TaxID=2593676 RepID=UPI0022570C86|nr:APC family permease [Streptomyces sp. NBC_00424]MCX5078292.1 APC family permease [Streptomyces sp. NBC_00424]